MKHSKSPLDEAIGGDEGGPGLFDDLTPFRSGNVADPERLPFILEAWVGLFGHHLRAHDKILTLDPLVMDFLQEGFRGTFETDAGNGADLRGAPRRWSKLSFPPGPETGDMRGIPLGGALFEKTIICMEPVKSGRPGKGWKSESSRLHPE